jgi:hypothetical protein
LERQRPGLTQTVLLGFENGMPYIDIRFNGTNGVPLAYIQINTDASLRAVAGLSQKWSGSVYAKLVAGTNPAVNTLYGSDLYLGGAYVTSITYFGGPAVLPSTGALSANRLSGNATTPASGIDQINGGYFYLANLPAAYIDFTIRIAYPQVEQATNGGATNPIPTSTGAATRNPDVLGYPAGSLSSSVGTAYAEVTRWAAAAPNSYPIYPSQAVLALGTLLQAYTSRRHNLCRHGNADAAEYPGQTCVGMGRQSVVMQADNRRGGGTEQGFRWVNEFGADHQHWDCQRIGVGELPVRNVRLFNAQVPDAQLTAMVA